MASFRLRHGRLRGTDSARLRGMTVGAAGTVYPGRATSGIVFQPHAVTTMVPDPRPRAGVIVAGTAGVTPTVRAGIAKRGPVRVTAGPGSVLRTAQAPTIGRRVATGHGAVPQVAVAPAVQPKEPPWNDTATGSPTVPKTATGSPKTPTVPKTATGSPKTPRVSIVPGDRR